MPFQKAEKRQAKLRLALIGPSGSGKTYTALSIAQAMGQKIALVDTEHESASLYADLFNFDSCQLTSFHPSQYIQAIKDAEKGGYDVLIIDSLSHAWAGKDGVLQFVDEEKARSKSQNEFIAWRKATPLHNSLVDALLSCSEGPRGMHLIVCMRSITKYVVEKDEKSGKTTVRKIGLEPVQRAGLEYEFTITADLDLDNNMIIGKTRCYLVNSKMFPKAGKEFADIVTGWLNSGAPAAPGTPAAEVNLNVPITKAEAEILWKTWGNWLIEAGITDKDATQTIRQTYLIETTNKSKASDVLKSQFQHLILPSEYRQKLLICAAKFLKRAKIAFPPAITKAVAEMNKPSPEPEKNPPVPPSNGHHWFEDEATRKAFWDWAESLDLTEMQVHEILKVEAIIDYQGTAREARDLITAHLNAQVKDDGLGF